MGHVFCNDSHREQSNRAKDRLLVSKLRGMISLIRFCLQIFYSISIDSESNIVIRRQTR